MTILSLALAPSAVAQEIAITGGTAWPLDSDDPVENATILVRDGTVISVEADGPVPEGAQRIDATGKVVTPGLFNAATQLGLLEVSTAAKTDDTASRYDDVGAGFDVASAINGNSVAVALARADGLTGGFAYPSSSALAPFSGMGAVLRLRDRFDIVERSKVAVVARAGGGAWKDETGSRAVHWQVLRAALAQARAGPAKKGGKKQHRPKDLDDILEKADSDALAAVRNREIPLIIRADRESDLRQAVGLARDFGIRVAVLGAVQAWRLAEELADAGVTVIIAPATNIPASFDELGGRQDNAAILARAGVPIAFGIVGGSIGVTFNPGISLREEVGTAVRNGLPWIEAMRAATVTPRAFLGGAANAGTLAPGAPADIVVWTGDPLEPASQAEHVLIDGQEMPTETRQDMLGRRYRQMP